MGQCVRKRDYHASVGYIDLLKMSVTVTAWLKLRFKRASVLQRAIANGHSVFPSVRPFVRHTRDPRLNASRYQHTFVPHDKVMFLISRSQIVVLSSGIHPELCVKEKYPPPYRQPKFDQ